MRPQGDIRKALRDAARAFAEEERRATYRDLAERARVGFKAASATVKNMAHAGELQAVGTIRADHARRPLSLYVLSQAQERSAAPLDTLMRTWLQRG